MTPILRIEDVSRRFGGYQALSHVTCEIAAGHIHALIGPNGAGKSTLLNVIGGSLRPNDGRLFFEENDYTRKRPDQISAMGIARSFQHVRLVPGLSVLENVMIGCHARIDRGPFRNLLQFLGMGRAEASARRTAREMLNFVGLPVKSHSEPDQMPLADQRRVEIARALASEPRLLLLDEPAAGLHPTDISSFSVLIQKIRGLGITTLLVEHNMRLIMSIADTVTVLRAGSVIANGPPAAIRQDAEVISAYLGTE
jgi:ABC-type branched-subunit amino acid transport system ATPase component